MNSATANSISAKLLSRLGKSAAGKTSKAALPFWLFLGRAKGNVPGFGKGFQKNGLAPGSRVGKGFQKNGLAPGSRVGKGQQKNGLPLGPFNKFVAALRELGLPLNNLRLPANSVVHLRSLLIEQGFSQGQVELLLKRCGSEDGTIDLDKVVASLWGVSDPMRPRQQLSVVRAEQRPELQGLLSNLGLPPQAIRKIIDGARTSGGDLDVERLAEGLRKLNPNLTSKDVVQMCRRQGIKVEPQELETEADSQQNALTTTKSITRTDSPDSPPASEHSHRLELATRLRREGARPEQVKALLEKLSGDSQFTHKMYPEGEKQDANSDDKIQALLSRLQPRTNKGQQKSAQRARLSKNMQTPSRQPKAQAAADSTGPDSTDGEATKVAATVLESQQELEQQPAKGLRAKLSKSAVRTDRVTKVVQGKEGLSEPLASPNTEGVAATKADAMSPSTTGGSLSRTSAPEPQFQVAQRLVIMTTNGERRARLNLHPPELGRIQIEISLESNKLSATLVTETRAVKELMESNLGQLRQHLAQHNLHLEDFQVAVGTDASPFKESQHEPFQHGKRGRQAERATALTQEVEPEMEIVSHLGRMGGGQRIDLFA